MKEEITIYTHEEFGELRAIDLEGQPFFIAKDVAGALGYKNPQEAVRNHCKGVSETLTPSKGGNQSTKIIPESDVYRLIMRSKLEEAERFQDWVCEEVLPSIRKTGVYAVTRAEDKTVAQILSEKIDAFKVQSKADLKVLQTMVNNRERMQGKPIPAWIGPDHDGAVVEMITLIGNEMLDAGIRDRSMTQAEMFELVPDHLRDHFDKPMVLSKAFMKHDGEMVALANDRLIKASHHRTNEARLWRFVIIGP